MVLRHPQRNRRHGESTIQARPHSCGAGQGLPQKAFRRRTHQAIESGAAAVVNRKTPDCMFAWIRKHHFVIQAPDPALHCTPQSIASHSLYENADPFKLIECSGTLDLTNSRYEALDERSVKVSGSTFIPAERYTVKLEGAEKAGYQSVVIGSVRDPFIIRQIDDWTERLTARIHARVKQV